MLGSAILAELMKTILVIEDNLEIRENTAEILELNGYKVVTAENGKMGYDLARMHKPNVIICDIMMPDTGGASFFRLIKADTSVSATPLIFFSAGSAPLEVKRGLQEGADVYLRKPFTENALLEAVEKCLNLNNSN